MKKLLALILALVLIFTLAACGQKNEPAAETPTAKDSVTEEQADGRKEIKIAYSVEQLTEGITLGKSYSDIWIKQFNESNSEYYISAVDYYSADYNVDTQIAQIEDVITKGYDALMISSLDRTAVLPALKEAHNAGVKVIDTRAELDGDFIDVWVDGLDNVKMGQAVKDLVIEYLDANPDVVLNTGIIWHEQTVTSCLPRCQGVKDLAEERPDQVKILAEIYTNSTEVAQSTMEDWLQAYPEMNFVDCSMDESARGAYNAIKSAGIAPGEILMASVDGSEIGCDMLAEGYLTWLIGFSLKDYYNIGVESAVKSVMGEYPVNYTAKLSDVRTLTADMDLEAYLIEAGWKS